MGALPFAAKGFGAPIGAPFGTPFNSQPMAALSVQDSHGVQPQPLEAGEASQNRSLFNGVQQRIRRRRHFGSGEGRTPTGRQACMRAQAGTFHLHYTTSVRRKHAHDLA